MHGDKYSRTARTATSCSSTRPTPARESRSARRARASGSASRPRASETAFTRTANVPSSAARRAQPSRTLEPRKNLETLVDAWRLLARRAGAGGRGRRGLGRSAAARRRRDPEARVRRRRARCPADTAAPSVRLPLAVRGLRDADRGGDGVRRARRRVLAPVAGRSLRRRRGPGRSRRSGGDRRRASRARSSGATSSRAAGIAHARAFTWRAVRRDASAGVRGGRG